MDAHRTVVVFRAFCLHLAAVAGACSGLAQWSAWAEEQDGEGAFRALRDRMVDTQIAREGYGREPVRDKSVLKAMRTVPRHQFVPERLREAAYADRPLPIGEGQTISQLWIVAKMTELLKPEPDDVVLEIGTGSGYQAAVLGEIVKEVYTIEIVPELGRRAEGVLNELEYTNVHTCIGDGYKGWNEHAPYDSIIVTAAPDHVPQPLVEQLKPGGRMVIPVGPRRGVQRWVVLVKQADGTVKQNVREAVRFVPLTRNEDPD